MLFLYRPRETWMPFTLPRNRTEQAAYNRQLQERFEATRRVVPPVPTPAGDPVGGLKDLAELRRAGLLTDAELASAKAKLLGG